eukprot:CAMPEP_0196579758 /NCGR_PEP_ID=MMETSP1081-20130531/24493_1 /TAXON_ID=36882 /ORGANISM="Pyramimonas amylifera, Strain CCMP720" /LENGTH=934 /DNA_ID=CAMNT_0041899429 /DNA_START=182 /DNA_END=2986 /DNA_ORIENTATION=+
MGCGSSTPATDEEKPKKGADVKKDTPATPASANVTTTAQPVQPTPAASTGTVVSEKPSVAAASGVDKFNGESEEAKAKKKAPKKKTDGARRRLAITTDFEEDEEAKDDYVLKVVPKSDEDKEKILKALSTNFMFKALEAALQQDIVNAMELFNVDNDATVITQGEKGDYFYVINSGKYDVFIRGKDEAVASLEYPSLFGELALMYSSPRAATIKAAEGGSLWRVDRTTFRGLLLSSAAARLVRFLRSVPVLQKYSEHALTQMAQSLEYRAFKEGTTITDNPTRFFIIRDGQVNCMKKEGGTTESIKVLKAKSFFGDRELLSGQSDDKYVAGKGGCKLLALSQKNFDLQLGTLQEPLQDHLKYHTLRDIPLLADVSADQLSEVVDSFVYETFAPNEYIIKQGNVGTKFYIMQKGKVKVHVNGKEVATLGAYTFFGERSLLHDDLTAADIVAASEDVTCLALERDAFNVLLGPLKDIIDKQNKLRMLRTVPILKTLSDMELDALSEVMAVVQYENKDVIIKQGTQGNVFFLIKSGEVIVTKEDDPEKELIRLSKGSFFGEKALLEDEPRAATISAAGSVQCFTIDRTDFTKHLGSLKDIMNVHAQKMQRQKNEKAVTFQDLEEVAVLGSGAFGLVTLVKNKKTGTTFALKAINKRYVQKTRTQPQLKREVLVLGEVDSPFLMHLIKTFRDKRRVYFLIEPLLGGELFSHLADANTFTEDRSRFYAACVILGLNHLHSKGIIYRDLKLENLLLDKKGYVKIVDFGFAKKLKKNEWTYTLCGTPDYLAPEILKGTGHNRGADYWSLGVLIYEMIFGYTPFGADDDSEICRNILSGSLGFDGKISKDAKDLIRKLLNRDCRARLGMGKTGVKAMLKHPWFATMDWVKLEKQLIKPPFVPEIEDDLDVSNFDEVDEESMHRADCSPCDDKILDAVFGEGF